MMDLHSFITMKSTDYSLKRFVNLIFILSLILIPACSIPSTPNATIPQVMMASTPSYVDTWKAQILDYDLGNSDNEIRFGRISLENGLSDPNITCMLQDKRGYLWFGTQNGLNRYNAYSFSIYKPKTDDLASLSDHWITALANGSDGSIWIGTKNGGLNQFSPETDKFIQYKNDPSNLNSLINNSINALIFDQDGFLWIATDDGLDRLDTANQKINHYRHDPLDPASISSNQILSLFEDQFKVLWVGTAKTGIDRMDRRNGTVIHFSADQLRANGLINVSINTLAEDKKGYLWIGTSSGLIRFNYQTNSFVSFRHAGDDQEDDNIHSIIVDRSGDVWIGSDQGLSRYNWQRSKFTDFYSQPGNTDSLSNNFILSILEDEEGTLWFGTYGSGLNKFDRDQNRFTIFRHDQNNPDSISSNLVYPIIIDTLGNIWVGTYDGGLNRIDGKTGKITHFSHNPNNPDSLASDNITALYQDKKGVLWIGTKAGLDKFNGKDKFIHFVHRATNETSISNNSVRSIYEDSKGFLWIGTDKGLNQLFDGSEAFINFVHVPDETSSISNNKITAISEDKNGDLWVGTLFGGLNRMMIDSEQFTHYQFDPQSTNTISNNSISTILKDKSGTLWVGTSGGGLNKYDPATDSFIHFSNEQGLPSNNIAGIEEDNFGNLWISTDAGICRFNLLTNQYITYSVNEGLPGNEFNIRAVAKDFNGRMYFGGVEGLTSFQPERLNNSTFSPPVVLTSFTNDGKDIEPSEKLDQINQFIFEWPQNSFEFEFAALGYSEPHKNQYAYMLENFEKNWNFIDTKRNGRYTNLPGGTYNLRLIASNKDGIWNEEGSTISIKVIPPVWETWWFRLIAFFGLIAFVLFIYRWRLKNIEKQNRELENQIQERTLQVNLRNQEIEALYRADEKMYRYLNINQALQALVDVAVELLKADKSSVLVWEENSGSWEIKAHQGFHPRSVKSLKLSQMNDLFQKIISGDKPLVMNEVNKIKKWAIGKTNFNEILLQENIHSIILLPLKTGEDFFGLFLIASKSSKAFNKDIQRLFISLAQRASLSIENALLFEQTKELAVMEERTRLARDLHDSAKQKAFAALAQIGAVRGAGKKNSTSVQEHIKEAENLVYEVIQELTFLIQEMYPLTLKEEGFLVALREYIFEWENRNDIQLDLNVKNEQKLALNIEQTLYRIIQEALANVSRHSQAKKVDIEVEYFGDRVEATVADNGKGFEKTRVCNGLGLRSMEERAASMGGKVEIESSPDKGVKVRIFLPI